MSIKSFLLPDLGEGLTEAEILHWLVAEGDTVRLNQPIVEVETAKAAVEIPSPYAGVVTTLHHAEGATVDVGLPLISFEVGGGDAAMTAEAPTIQGGDLVPSAPKADADEKIEVLVGSGPKAGKLTRRPRKQAAVAAAVTEPAALAEVHVLAKPPVRKLARDLGVDLRGVGGTGPNGSVTRADVQAAAGGRAPISGHGQGAAAAIAAVLARPDFDPATREQRVPVKGVRKATAAAMVQSAFSAPHVTEWVTVDVTETMELSRRMRSYPEFEGVKVSPLLLVARALLLAVRRHPMINASWDDGAQEIVVKDYVNLGIAAATPRGLIVPNIKDAGALTLPQLAAALDALVATAREGKTPPADMQRGTITITNVGVFGVDSGTPILNPGESAILCFGAVREQPWVHEGQIAVRQVTTLALSFDHRIVDGQLGSEFLADIAAMLNDPWRMVDFSG
ncbi:MAG TPA: dihydrolipoamide acetyltransferase family protein [Mycobacteriales bacterium]|nr:dihydrolipoamide acetyltransferase family protein [Mycobacteriales bacterium]